MAARKAKMAREKGSREVKASGMETVARITDTIIITTSRLAKQKEKD